jgi:hypothetical protein
MWFYYTELSHFATVLIHFEMLSAIFYTLNLAFFFCYSAQPFCDFCYNYLNHFVILSEIFYTLNSPISATVLSHFLIATVLSYSVILLYWTQPFLYSAHSFWDLVSNFLYTKLSLFLLQCSSILWFLLQLPQSFCHLVRNFLYTELSHFLATVLNHSLLIQCLDFFQLL